MFESQVAPAAKTDLALDPGAVRRYRTLLRRKEWSYRMLYEFTFNQCGACVESGCACKDRICQHVEEQALKRGHKFQHTGHALRFIGSKGCIIPPHLRETCTIYLCTGAQTKPGFDRKRYERIKSLCGRIDYALMELEDRFGLAIATN